MLTLAVSDDREWEPFARLVVGSRLAAAEERAVDFEVTNDAGGFHVGGVWRRLRRDAYGAARSVE